MEALHHPMLVAHHDSIIVAVRGVYRNNAHRVKAAIGVFVHPNSFHNHSELLCNISAAFQTITKLGTEGLALVHALRMAIAIREQNDAPRSGSPSPYHRLSRIVIKSDSSYVVRAMTNWIYRWRADDYVGHQAQR